MTVVTTCWKSPTKLEKCALKTSRFLYLILLRRLTWLSSGSSGLTGLVNCLCPALCPRMTMWAMLCTEGACWSRIKGMVPTGRTRLMPAACTHIPAMLATRPAGQTTPWPSPRAVRVSLRNSDFCPLWYPSVSSLPFFSEPSLASVCGIGRESSHSPSLRNLWPYMNTSRTHKSAGTNKDILGPLDLPQMFGEMRGDKENRTDVFSSLLLPHHKKNVQYIQ